MVQMEMTGGDAWERHQRIVLMRNGIEKTFLALGEDLYWFEEKKQYKELNYATFEAYLADPDVDITRRLAFMLKGIYETFVVQLKVHPDALLEAGTNKLDMIRSHATKENVNELICEAESLSKRDLRIKLNDGKENDAIIKDDKAEKLAEKWGVESGQVWKLGKHLLMCGDAYNMGIITNRKEIHALITDPPYGIGYKPDWNKWDGTPSDFGAITGDDQEFNPTPFMNYPTVVMFGANYFSNKIPVGGWICWDKRLDENKDQMFGSPFELAWFRSINTTRKSIMIRVLHGGVVNADSIDGNNEKRLHATQKPVAVMQKIIDIVTEQGNTVLDPFSGSGSTILACDNTNRLCVAVEIEPKYVAVTLQRWMDATGETPCLE